MAVRAFLLLAGPALAAAEVKPLLTTDIFVNTYGLFYTAYEQAWAKAGVDGLLAQVPVDDLRKTIAAQMKHVPPEVTTNIDMVTREATVKSVQVKALLLDFTDEASQVADQVAAMAVTNFEKALPQYKGLIRKTMGNLLLTVAYMMLVMYLILKVSLFVVRTVLGVTTCVLCCLCCCRCRQGSGGGAAAKATAKKSKVEEKGKAAAKTVPKADNSKAAAAPAKKK